MVENGKFFPAPTFLNQKVGKKFSAKLRFASAPLVGSRKWKVLSLAYSL